MQKSVLSPLTAFSASPSGEGVRVLCSDLYLAAYLLEKGALLHSIRFDEASRASLVITGADAPHHRRAYAAGDVCVSLPSFRQTLNALRDLVHDLQERHHPKNKTFAATGLRIP